MDTYAAPPGTEPELMLPAEPRLEGGARVTEAESLEESAPTVLGGGAPFVAGSATASRGANPALVDRILAGAVVVLASVFFVPKLVVLALSLF